MRIAVRRKDTGLYLYPSSYSAAQWGPDLQKARLFGRKNDATNAGRNSLPHGRVNGRWGLLPDAPELEQVGVTLALSEV